MNTATKHVHVWNWNGAALTKNTSQHSDSVLRLHVILKIKVHFAHYRLQVKEVWEISCAVASTYFEAIVPFTTCFKLQRWHCHLWTGQKLHRISHCVHLGSLGRSRTFIFAQQGMSTAAPARTGVGVGTSAKGLSSPAPEGGKEGLVLPQRCLTVLQGFARHSYIRNISRNRATPLQNPSSYTTLFLFSPAGQPLTLFIVGKCPICKMWVG